MTDLINRAKEALDGATPGPWVGCNMTHQDHGGQMTPEELGEYVCNSVKMGDPNRFLFVSANHHDGNDVDVCHTGNGPRGTFNTALIALAPDLARLSIAAGELADAGTSLDKAASKVPSMGAQTGPQWTQLVIAIQSHRSALARFRAIAEGKE